MKQLTALTLLEVIDEGAPVGTTAYLELLFDALEDGDISETESDALAEVRADYDLTAADVTAAHEALLLALAHRAVDDGHVSHEERRELRSVASLLGVPDGTVKAVLNRADAARHARLSAGLGPLPDPWPHGVPLRVGDRIAFTGCEERQRERLERRAEELGVRVSGAVSGRTTMLITDGSFSGGKLARSLELGTRTVHPDVFEVLLRHLQPASAIGMMPAPSVTAPTAISSRSGAQDEIGRPSPSAIRAWAVAQGYEVGVRGRLPREVLDAYAKAV
ncbi:Lsr2 family DNA-binding protein [Curtobacterium sp. Leaf261]|uniref:Lsr2 family DNA-binding protein n=1 Tax=Curtobacterium sp. Leaf261 TaxID=1736311 RepID=UPI001F1B25B7|nr:histone-like nucleoid-structuring protein Lsr2 [Curtobacterium sp. Leaf261]